MNHRIDIATHALQHGRRHDANRFRILRKQKLRARTVGILVAGLAAIASFMWLPYFPVWAILIIAVCVLSIWALTARGSDITSRD